MIVAISTYYRKSAGLSLAAEVARHALPHMIMPQPGSPENFMAMLGGILPPNFSDIPQADRARLEKGNRFAAQRGLLRDELSGLFKSMGRDYMAGLKELIMTLYDCPAYLDSNTNNKGLVVIRDAALSILGAATPAELSTALSANDWYNGNLARFVLLTPETDYHERPAPRDSQAPTELADRLRKLHEQLPAPPLPNALGDAPDSEAWSLVAEFWSACHAYEQALRAMTAPQSTLDDRLRATNVIVVRDRSAKAYFELSTIPICCASTHLAFEQFYYCRHFHLFINIHSTLIIILSPAELTNLIVIITKQHVALSQHWVA